MSKIKLFLIVFLFAGCSVPDFMIQGQLNDFERALEEEDVNWIMDQFTDDVVRELPDGFKFKGKDEGESRNGSSHNQGMPVGMKIYVWIMLISWIFLIIWVLNY